MNFAKPRSLISSEALEVACVPSGSYADRTCENSSLVLTRSDFHLFVLNKEIHESKIYDHFPGNPPLLLLPDNVRIRRYNISSEQYSDYIDNQERIQALDYDWDPEGIGLSEYV